MMVSRTGFTGDLGWSGGAGPGRGALDQLFELDGLPDQTHRFIRPDIARIEALPQAVDFTSEEVVRNGRTRSPFELGLEWLVDFSKPLFNGRAALLAEKARGFHIGLPCSTSRATNLRNTRSS